LQKKFEFVVIKYNYTLIDYPRYPHIFCIKKMRERERERERERKRDLLRYLDIQRNNLFIYMLQTMKMYFKKDSKVYKQRLQCH